MPREQLHHRRMLAGCLPARAAVPDLRGRQKSCCPRARMPSGRETTGAGRLGKMQRCRREPAPAGGSTRKSNMSVRVMAAAMSLRCRVRRLFSSLWDQDRRVDSRMNISHACTPAIPGVWAQPFNNRSTGRHRRSLRGSAISDCFSRPESGTLTGDLSRHARAESGAASHACLGHGDSVA